MQIRAYGKSARYLIEQACDAVDTQDGASLSYVDFNTQYVTRPGTEVARFKLRVARSDSLYAARTTRGHRSTHVCWHGHYRFFEELFKLAEQYPDVSVRIDTQAPFARKSEAMRYTSLSDLYATARYFNPLRGNMFDGFYEHQGLCLCDS